MEGLVVLVSPATAQDQEVKGKGPLKEVSQLYRPDFYVEF
jgi:hypothetical protein